MDDLVLVHNDKAQLHQWKEQIIQFLHDELCLTVHPRKTRLFPARSGVEFVGYRTWQHRIRVRRSTVQLLKRRWKHLLYGYQEGTVSKDELREIFYAWVAHMKHASPKQVNRLIRKLYEQYKEVAK